MIVCVYGRKYTHVCSYTWEPHRNKQGTYTLVCFRVCACVWACAHACISCFIFIYIQIHSPSTHRCSWLRHIYATVTSTWTKWWKFALWKAAWFNLPIPRGGITMRVASTRPRCRCSAGRSSLGNEIFITWTRCACLSFFFGLFFAVVAVVIFCQQIFFR